MGVSLGELVAYCDRELESARFSDYCPNGLQVEGRPTIARIACAVSANQQVLDEAIAWGADALLVHHGYFWRGEPAPLVGMKGRRIATLLGAGLSLIAYHLPLDAHPRWGNNAQFGERLGIGAPRPLYPEDPTAVGSCGQLPQPTRLSELCQRIETLTGRAPLLIGDAERAVREIAWCTGAAQGYIDRAVAAGAEVYISGEVSEPTVHAAREQGIAYIAAGHHATERYGVQTLSAALAERWSLEWRFIDCDNPV